MPSGAVVGMSPRFLQALRTNRPARATYEMFFMNAPRRRALPGDRNAKRLSKTIEVIEETDHARDLDNLGCCPPSGQFRVDLVGHIASCWGHRVRKCECRAPGWLEGLVQAFCERRYLQIGCAVLSRQCGMRRQAIAA